MLFFCHIYNKMFLLYNLETSTIDGFCHWTKSWSSVAVSVWMSVWGAKVSGSRASRLLQVSSTWIKNIFYWRLHARGLKSVFSKQIMHKAFLDRKKVYLMVFKTISGNFRAGTLWSYDITLMMQITCFEWCFFTNSPSEIFTNSSDVISWSYMNQFGGTSRQNKLLTLIWTGRISKQQQLIYTICRQIAKSL